MVNVEKRLFELLEKHVPENAVGYCFDLWKEAPFHFKVTRKRNTKAGDYRFDPRSRQHTITVNHDLNQYAFLITYVHEVAHLRIQQEFARRVSPHGVQWKNEFRTLMLPMLNDLVFPSDVLKPLAAHMRSPKASSYSDHRLTEALRKHDPQGENLVSLARVSNGSAFSLNNRVFKKGVLRRTRFICEEVDTGRNFLISKSALVEILG
ncbi:MAG: transcription elongation protein SprT [Bacteroidota bacterium]